MADPRMRLEAEALAIRHCVKSVQTSAGNAIPLCTLGGGVAQMAIAVPIIMRRGQ
jgi:hypothetical protein